MIRARSCACASMSRRITTRTGTEKRTWSRLLSRCLRAPWRASTRRLPSTTRLLIPQEFTKRLWDTLLILTQKIHLTITSFIRKAPKERRPRGSRRWMPLQKQIPRIGSITSPEQNTGATTSRECTTIFLSAVLQWSRPAGSVPTALKDLSCAGPILSATPTNAS